MTTDAVVAAAVSRGLDPDSFADRSVMADDPETPSNILEDLALDPHRAVRWMAIANPSTPTRVIELIAAGDEDSGNRLSATMELDERRLAEGTSPPGLMPTEDPAPFPQILWTIEIFESMASVLKPSTVNDRVRANLKEINRLHDQGEMTPEVFEALNARLLGLLAKYAADKP